MENDKITSYLRVEPANGGITDIFRYLVFGNIATAAKFLESSDEKTMDEESKGNMWVNILSVIMRKLIKLFDKPMEWTGYVVDFVLNFISLNGHGGLLSFIFRLVQGKIVIPKRDSETFISTVGQIDGRLNLDPGDDFGEIQLVAGHRSLMDLSMMASKLAYENAALVRNAVNISWKMHFVDFYDCWNEFQKELATHLFIFCDKPKDANLIVVSFRGTEPFNADAWITDLDYTWHRVEGLGKVHTGFFEALGLGDRSDVSSFGVNLARTNRKLLKGSFGYELLPAAVRMGAYVMVRSTLTRLLEEHKNAKFVVTGHSLGGALAIMFVTVLVHHGEEELLQRLLAVHTFGQPRIGNREVRDKVEPKLQNPTPRYYRMVYCNDVVPRLPYDDKTFLYKHFGICLHYSTFFVGQIVEGDIPNRNDYEVLYLIPKHMTALWELMRGMVMGMIYGPEYKESWVGIAMRIMGLALPGVSAHAPPNYVNSIRLGIMMHTTPPKDGYEIGTMMHNSTYSI